MLSTVSLCLSSIPALFSELRRVLCYPLFLCVYPQYLLYFSELHRVLCHPASRVECVSVSVFVQSLVSCCVVFPMEQAVFFQVGSD